MSNSSLSPVKLLKRKYGVFPILLEESVIEPTSPGLFRIFPYRRMKPEILFVFISPIPPQEVNHVAVEFQVMEFVLCISEVHKVDLVELSPLPIIARGPNVV